MKEPKILSYSLSPFSGEFNTSHLMHLLRRTLFGVGHKDLTFFSGKNLEDCLAMLLKQSSTIDQVLQGDEEFEDPYVPKGKTWVNAPFENTIIDTRRRLMLKMWWVENIITRDFSLTEKMTLFWHNHFVTEMDVVKDSRYSYSYVALLRKHALGNFKQLIREGSTNVAMLVYLNGNGNEQNAPNENYSRELMELFTIGKEEVKGYSESDVKAAARVLSGWKDDKEKITAVFHPELHDTGDKHFSAFFDNAVIRGVHGEFGGSIELDELIDIIFKRRETAKFVCRNLYRWFVCSQIGEEVEKQIIDPLAQIFIDHDFEIIPVLETLLSSEHFFDTTFRGCIVKNPVEFFIGSMIQFNVLEESNLIDNHEIWIDFYVQLGFLAMDPGNPPSVAGWPAYYQPPKFHQWWINSSSLNLRAKIVSDLCTKEGLFYNGFTFKFHFIPFVSNFEHPEDEHILVENCISFLFSVAINDSEKEKLTDLLNGQANQQESWTELWKSYQNKKDDIEKRESTENRLREFFKRLLNLPEFQMM